VIASPKVRMALCEEKQRLRVHYSRAVVDHSRAADEMLLARGTLRRTASTTDGVIFRLPPLTYQAVGCRLQIQAEGFFLR